MGIQKVFSALLAICIDLKYLKLILRYKKLLGKYGKSISRRAVVGRFRQFNTSKLSVIK